MSSIKKWLAAGSGVGIQIVGPREAESMHVAAVRVRPGGAPATRILRGGFSIANFSQHAVGVWGPDYARSLRKLGMQHVAATVVLPRQEVIVRPVVLPGVSDKDLAGAMRFTLEGLHPYGDDEVFSSWVRLRTSTVLVAVVRKEIVRRYASLFAEAEIKIGAFSCSAATVYSALRVFGEPVAREILAWDDSAPGVMDFYGESPARPLLSSCCDLDLSRAGALFASELRLAPRIECNDRAVPLSVLVGAKPAVAYAAALASACPRLSLPLNLLPAGMREKSSLLPWMPPTATGAIVLLLAGALAAFPKFEERRFQRSLQEQIAAVVPSANRAVHIDRDIATADRRLQLLDDFRSPKADLDMLAELTRILPPPTWLKLLEISRGQVIVDGETDEAAPLLKILDGSPLFEFSEFQIGPVPTPTGAMFRIKTHLKGDRPYGRSGRVVVSVESVEKGLIQVRELAARVSENESTLQAVRTELAKRESGFIQAYTAAQAKAQLLQILERLCAAESPPVRIVNNTLGGMSRLGDDYGSIDVAIEIRCSIEQLLNLLSAMAAQPELISTTTLRIISSNNLKDKIVSVYLAVSGAVPRQLVLQKEAADGL